MQEVQKAYTTFFGVEKPDYEIFSPYRVCPLGAHSDHQHGIVTGIAFDKGINLLLSKTEDGSVEMISFEFDGLVGFNVLDSSIKKQEHWGDYLRGCVLSLRRHYPLKKGLKGVVKGSIPIGGLASSAALICGFIIGLAKANNIELTKLQIINYASYVEREFVGLKNGLLDHACAVLSEANKLLFFDTDTQKEGQLPFELGIFFSGVTRKLTQTNFNIRATECKAAAWMLYSYDERKLKQLEDTHLREIDVQTFEKHKDKMPENFRKRATHFFTEFERVKKGVEAWKKGDLKQFGKLLFESCQSSTVNYECSSPELKAIYEIMKTTDGIYGGRYSGAGFKGACFAIVDPTKKQQIEEKLTKEYLRRFPQYKDSFEVYFCKSTDGTNFVNLKQTEQKSKLN